LVGGPPCQAFARVGRAKLREVMEHPEAFLHDSRSGLYRHYIRFVGGLAPIVMVVRYIRVKRERIYLGSTCVGASRWQRVA
jgi:DNA (cytosine-5)-methyltransferase 1